MASVIERPTVAGIFAITLGAVAKHKKVSTAEVVRNLMTDAWGPNLENAPTGENQNHAGSGGSAAQSRAVQPQAEPDFQQDSEDDIVDSIFNGGA